MQNGKHLALGVLLFCFRLVFLLLSEIVYE